MNLQYLLFAKYIDRYYQLSNGVHLSLSKNNQTIVKDSYINNLEKLLMNI